MSSSIELTIQDLSRAGAGVAREPSGRVIFVPLTAPGDRVRVEIIEEDKRYAQARLLEILEPSPQRVKAPCPAFGRCGGCQWQHLPYEFQWRTKRDGVLHALKRVQVEAPGPIDELPAANPWGYRNRVQLRGSGDEIGFFAAGSKSLVPIDRCEIARAEINAEIPKARADGRTKPPYKVEIEVLENGQVRSHWNARHAAGGFRQVNDEQNEHLRAWVAGALTGGGILWDLYGGAGNLSLPLAARYTEVHCVDVSVPSRAPEGTHPGFRFHRSPVGPWLARRKGALRADACVLDPPREGLSKDLATVLDAVEQAGVRELVAVGCDVDSWARDVARLTRRGWRLARVGALDLFPQTPHVEALALLLRA